MEFPRIITSGDTAIVVEFEEKIDKEINEKVKKFNEIKKKSNIKKKKNKIKNKRKKKK